MPTKISRRLFFVQLFLLSACGVKSRSIQSNKLNIGVVSYGEGRQAIDQYADFNNYLSEETGALIEMEPAFNETRALERINDQAWSMIFAPPGLAAIAISEKQYRPLFPLAGSNNLRSIIVVRKNSSIKDISQLNGQTFAIGQPGSATGYYFPLYNLYGLQLADILFAPTPKTVLEWVAERKTTAGALSEQEFNTYSSQVSQTEFKVLYTDPHNIPPGAVLIDPTIERNFQKNIRRAMSEATSELAQKAGYIPSGSVPSYQYMTTVVKRVRSIANHVKEKPAPLF